MKERSFSNDKAAVWCLIGATAVLCVVGAMAQFLDLPLKWGVGIKWVLVLSFAALCGFSLWVANVAAACAQVLAEHRTQKPWAFSIALFTAGVCGAVSVIGIDLAWLSMIGEQQDLPPTTAVIAAGFALGFVKVAMGFVIAACEGVTRAAAQTHDALLEERNRRITELEQLLRDAMQKPLQAKAAPVAGARPARVSNGDARRMARALGKQPPAPVSERGEPVGLTLVEPEARDVSLDEIKTACRAIMERRDGDDVPMTPSLRLVSGQLNVPRSRVDKALLQANTKLTVVVENLKAA